MAGVRQLFPEFGKSLWIIKSKQIVTMVRPSLNLMLTLPQMKYIPVIITGAITRPTSLFRVARNVGDLS
jgi:ABC-type proline/glycine betaine transport system permease subunit